MNDHVVIIGIGQLGRVFAGGLLRTGHSITPVNRGDDIDIIAARVPDAKMVLVAVAEADLHAVLQCLPPAWRSRTALIQNELLPRDWLAHDIVNPTVISVWFEKKKGTDAKPILPSPVFGPEAPRVVSALASIDLPARLVDDDETMLWELVRKNLYILTTNIAGLVVGGDVGTLKARHTTLMEGVAHDVLDIQVALTGRQYDRTKLMQGLLDAIEADPTHACAGRSAAARLMRALQAADAHRLSVPTLRQIATRLAAGTTPNVS